MTMWLLVADSRKAKLFSAPNARGALTEFAGFVHPVEMEALRDTTGGPSFGDVNGTRHAGEPQTTVRKRELNAFARELARYLGHEFSNRHFSALTLAAPPEFLGALRDALDDSVQQAVHRSIDKNLLGCTAQQLSEYLNPPRTYH